MKFCKLMACALVGGVLPSLAAGSLLVDGNFDLATSGTQTSGSPWTLIANSPDGTDESAQYQTGFANAQNTGVGGSQPPGTGTGVWFRSFEGNQGGSGEPGASATLTQVVMAPSDGDYTLDFVAGREVNFTADSFSVSLFSNGSAGSATLDLLTPAIPDGNLGGAASGNPGGTPFSITLPGVSTGDVLVVVAVMANGQDSQIPGGQSAFLDSFALNVPEPASAALVSLVGLTLVRRRR